jgi:hypothetical protein
MEKELDAKSYWKGVKARRDRKVKQGVEKNQAFKDAMKELNDSIFEIVAFAQKHTKPVT